ncbi:MAG: hypothetical protein A2W99_07135 [Bacteroidetes bacterium GWF2_33_16]|nr:MAG: hypothetical protein A2X00_11915 [Bacteroidetes bacterium GWE2_32_14]OFY03166.1 MAG: hypothetical protein A2W99_07135 [Bacteroidetes bacterium GWF2_33_16]
MDIQYINHSQINKQSWDSAIKNSTNGLVYAVSWYLDIVSPNWDALIVDDYQYIMPIPIRKKLGRNFFYQPVFAHQLGVFSAKEITPEIVGAFIDEVSKQVDFIDIKLNNQNPVPQKNIFYSRTTQILDLNKGYSEISTHYNRSLQSNLSKSKRVEFTYSVSENPEVLISLMHGMYKRKNVEGINSDDFSNLSKIIEHAIKNDIGKIYCAYLNDQICSAMFVLNWKDREYTFYGTNSLGREKRSMVALMDYFIRENTAKNSFLDFCGSNIPGVAEWNLGFGAQNHIYYGVHLNNLPLWLKWTNRKH